jgi:autotransporter-associated beta strand protein
VADLLAEPGNSATALSLNIGSVGQRVIYRGDALGAGPAGAFTRVRLASGTTLPNGLLPNALADASSTGSGNSFATYDTTVDAAGIIGVRPLRVSEYVTGSLIRNPVNGGVTPVTANYLIDGSTSAFGASNTINSLTFAGLSSLTLGAGQQLDMTNSPGILAQSGAMAVIDGGKIITSNAFTGVVVFFHLQGDGDLTLHNTTIAPLPAANSLQVIKLGAGALTLDGARIVDPIYIRQGTLRVAPGDGISGSQLTLDAGTTLALTGDSARIGSIEGAGSILLGAGELTLGRGALDGSISGSGGLRVTGQGFTLRSPASYSGPTRIDSSGGSAFALTNSGSALMSSKFVIAGGTLILDRIGSVPSRIGVVPIELNSGAITFNGDSEVATKQSAGLLSSAGFSKVSVQPFGSTGPLTHLEFSGIERVDRGAFNFTPGSGSGANARITFGSEAMTALIGAGTNSTNQPVLPFAVSGNSLITYDRVTGVRVLDTFTETSSTLVAGSNVRLNSTTTLASDIAINSLTSFSTTVNGPGTLTVNSGVILGNGVISAPVNFGNAEAHLYGPNFPDVLSLAGPISGSNGVTISAAYPSATIELGGQNTFTGPLTINAGILRFSLAANLGGDTSAIVINDARLEYAGGSAFVLTRPLRLNGYSATLAAYRAGPLTIAQPISGTGGLLIQGDVILTATNTYTGTTNVEGKLTISSDAALGSGPLRLASVPETLGLLTLAGPWTTSRPVEIGVTSSPTFPDTIDTAGFDAALNGPLTSGVGATPSLIKIGAGNLSIADAATYMGDLFVNGGTVSINSAMPAGGVLSVGINGTLAGTGTIQRMATVNGTLAPGNGGPGTLSVAGVSFANGSTCAIDISSVSAFDQLNCSGTVSLSGTINLALVLGFDRFDGLDSFVVIANDGADAIIGTGRLAIDGNPLDEGEMFSVGSQEFRISYSGGTGNDVVLTAVPEPTTCILLIAGSSLLGARRLRKSNARPFHSAPSCGKLRRLSRWRSKTGHKFPASQSERVICWAKRCWN